MSTGRISARGSAGRIAVAVALTAAALAPASAHAQGGAPAPDFSEPCPALYPGDDAARERIARWMARGAADRGVPHELPVMAAIAESGIRNIRGTGYHGFFGMHESLSTGAYRGFPRNPDLQLDWFLDTAMRVRQRLLVRGRPDPAGSSSSFGEWIADVERPAPPTSRTWPRRAGSWPAGARRRTATTRPGPASWRVSPAPSARRPPRASCVRRRWTRRPAASPRS